LTDSQKICRTALGWQSKKLIYR